MLLVSLYVTVNNLHKIFTLMTDVILIEIFCILDKLCKYFAP
mgnify:CR=1 FL=1